MKKFYLKIIKSKNIQTKIILGFVFGLVFWMGSFAVFAQVGDKIGVIDMSADNKIKVCKDVTCTDPVPGLIDFEISDGSPLVINKENQIIGKVWGNELGFISFKHDQGGVTFANPETGLLKGTAWSDQFGEINFSVTGQQVVIDPQTGEWQGWAWVAGPYGGWIKFDCSDDSCVRTTWHDQESQKGDLSLINENTGDSNLENSSNKEVRIKNIFLDFLRELGLDVVNFYEKVGQIIVGFFSSLLNHLEI